MFNSEFFPTNEETLIKMGIDCSDKVVLEPSAGKGDIIDYLYNNGAKRILAYEFNDDLRSILEGKVNILGKDFFNCTSEMISHIDLIVMNPPFSNAHEHIQHAYEIAPDGCEIISLCNYETIEKGSRYRKLSLLIRDFGNTQNLGSCFDTAERKTNVEIGLIKLFKPLSSDSSGFDGFFMEEDEEEAQGEGIMKFNEVRALVQRYVGAMETFDRMKELGDEMNYTTSPLGLSEMSFNFSYKESVKTKEEFSKFMQKVSWKHIFSKMNLNKYITTKVSENINKFVEQQDNVPFTMKNVYRMFEIIAGTRQNTMNMALEEVIDNFTKYTHENRFEVEGWKTNSSYMLNKKFIVEGVAEQSWSGGTVEIKYPSYKGAGVNKINDLTKVLCMITGGNYDNIGDVYQFNCDTENADRGGRYLQSGKWYDWGFFEFKVFKKGTMHLKFKNTDDWYMLNQAYGKLKGFTLTENYK